MARECRFEYFVSGAIDGELGFFRTLVFRHHIRRCTSCAELFRRLQSLTLSEWESDRLSEEESELLWRRIASEVPNLRPMVRRRPATLRLVLVPAALAVLATAVIFTRWLKKDYEYEAGDCIVEWVESEYEALYYQPQDGPTVIWVFEPASNSSEGKGDES